MAKSVHQSLSSYPPLPLPPSPSLFTLTADQLGGMYSPTATGGGLANAGTNTGEIAGDGIDNDLNGYTDDVNGWDFVANDKTVYDGGTADAHGTHVAGTIGAVGGKGLGVLEH